MKKVPRLDMPSNDDFIVFQTRTPERRNQHIKKTRKTRKQKTKRKRKNTVKSLFRLLKMK